MFKLVTPRALACGFVLVLACSHGPRGPYELGWMGGKPPRLQALDRSALYNERVRVELVDDRPSPVTIFGARKGGDSYHTDEDMAVWAAAHFARTLGEYGVPVVDSGETLLLRLSLTRLLVTEANTYRGEMNCAVDASRPGQPQPVWRGAIQAGSNRWGGTAELKMYRQVLASTVIDAARDLLDEPGFLASLRPAVAVPQLMPPPPPPPLYAPAPCPKCGARLVEGAQFCSACGAAAPGLAKVPATIPGQ